MLQRDLAALAGGTFDLAVVGAGMFGAAAALDAAQRGLKVALIERGDFGGATSAHSFKMIHGGIRYLQHADLYRVRQSAAARAAFLRVAPHLAKPLPIVVPTYGQGMKGKPVLRAGMAAYDLATFDRNRGIGDPSRRIPAGYALGRDEVLKRYPGLDRNGLTGAGVFADGQMYNPTRLVLAFVQSAAGEGAAVANHLCATGLDIKDGRVRAVRVQDRLTGDRFDVRAKAVLNAAGPYAQRLLLEGSGLACDPVTPFSRDAYFIVPRPLIGGDRALTIPAFTPDAEARVSRGGRHLFLVPWRGVTLVGVWHKVFPGHPDAYEITPRELARWLGEVNQGYAGLDLTPDDVAMGSAGLVPFGEGATPPEDDDGEQELKFAHRSRVVDHARTHGIEGLVTLIGVRYTTAPVEAPPVIDAMLKKLGRPRTPSRLATTPVHGGDLVDFEALVAEIEAKGLAQGAARALAHNHGSAYGGVLALAGGANAAALRRSLPGVTVTPAEILHVARNEMAETLADVVFRRTDLATAGTMTPAALAEAARLVAEAKGWSEDRRRREVAFVEGRLKTLALSGRAMLADALPEVLAPA
ncbi:MAG: FAD-dependent oxidoreductase [Geminicoccaceae bacterium]|nr:FAD-dependent oxidoreductase [Geminicoccaceae bacterium]